MIIASILLTMTGVVVFYASSIIDANRQMMEFEYGKDLMVYAAEALEQVALGTGGARTVKFSLSSAGINFVERAFGKLEVYVNGVKVIEDYPSVIVLRGGTLVSTVFRMLRPEVESAPYEEYLRLIVGAGEPLVVVYENFSGGAVVVLAPKRIRANYLGVYEIPKGGGVFERYSYYEISYIKVTFGKLGGSGQISITMRNVGVNESEYFFDGCSRVTVRCVLDGHEEELEMGSVCGARGAIVRVRIVNVEVSTG